MPHTDKKTVNLDPTLYDYAIVGAGIAGMAAAEALSRISNKRVILIEREHKIASCFQNGNC